MIPSPKWEIATDRLLFPMTWRVHTQAYEEYLGQSGRSRFCALWEQLNAGAGSESSDEAYMRLHLMAERGLITEKAAGTTTARHQTSPYKRPAALLSGREGALAASGSDECAGPDMFSLDDW